MTITVNSILGAHCFLLVMADTIGPSPVAISSPPAHSWPCPARVRPFGEDATIYDANQRDNGEITVYRWEKASERRSLMEY